MKRCPTTADDGHARADLAACDMTRVLAIDPASRVTGYAVLTGLERDDLVEAGVLRARRGRVESGLEGCALRALPGIYAMTVWLNGLIAEIQPSVIIVEVPSGLIGTGVKRGARGSLTTYGLAAGMLFATAMTHRDDSDVYAATEREWTRSVGSKARRQLAVRALYSPRYDPAEDRGGDIADAIMLGRWLLHHAPAKER